MADAGDTRQGTRSPAGMPRWVKVFLIIAVVLALGFVVTRLAGVEHGPGLHTPPVQHSP
ncbi:MAG: hypothetical protein ACRDIZ_06360 [Actinomycetota bacterium]